MLPNAKKTHKQLNKCIKDIYIMNAKYEREIDFENFSARITGIEIVVEKILAFEVLGAKWSFWSVPRVYS
jgi:hypothetical protein